MAHYAVAEWQELLLGGPSELSSMRQVQSWTSCGAQPGIVTRIVVEDVPPWQYDLELD